jgi:hypothetical protein
VDIVPRSLGRRSVDRLAAAFLLLLMAVGSVVLWLGLPVAGLWALSKLTDSGTTHFLLSLFLIPAAMVLFAPALFWMNGLYLRVVGALPPEDEDEYGRWRVRGPLELFLYAGMILALVALIAWLLFFATSPPLTVW